MNCPNCNYEMGNADLVCPRCKERGVYRMRPRQAPPTIVNNVYVSTPPAQPAPMDPVAVGFFAVIGAWIGAHLLGAASIFAGCVPACGCLAFFALLVLMAWAGSHMH